MRPLIGISCSHDYENDKVHLTRFYTRAVIEAGGLPLLLAPAELLDAVVQYVDLLDGLLLSGGVDVDPRYFGESPLPQMNEITPERDAFEIPLVQRWLAFDKPLLAICRGVQVLNIAAGGDIYQDIAGQCGSCLKHMQQAPKWYGSHEITIRPESLLSKILHVQKLYVNSFHHQAIRKAATGFVSSAYSSDGIIEAVESVEKKFILGVQWHPECMWEKDKRQQMLFRALVEACDAQAGFSSKVGNTRNNNTLQEV